MKKMWMVLLAVLSMGAQNVMANAGTGLVPNVSANCSNYSGLLDVVSGVKLDEYSDTGEAILSFDYTQGMCAGGKFHYQDLKKYFQIRFWQEGMNWPWAEEVALSESFPVSEHTRRVQIFISLASVKKNPAKDRVLTFVLFQSNDKRAQAGATRRSWSINLDRKLRLSIH